MPASLRNSSHPRLSGAAPAAFTGTGIAAAFGAAACCGLPFLLASAGLGTTWLGSLALVTSAYRVPLLILAAISLVAGALLLARQQRLSRTCSPGGACASWTTRILTLLGLVAGFVLLWLGYSYV